MSTIIVSGSSTQGLVAGPETIIVLMSRIVQALSMAVALGAALAQEMPVFEYTYGAN